MKNTIHVQHYQSPCGELLLGSYEDSLCLCDWTIEKHHAKVVRRLQKSLHADYQETASDILNETARNWMNTLPENGEILPSLYCLSGQTFRRRYGTNCWKSPTGRRFPMASLPG